MKLQLKRSNVLELGAAKEPTSAQMEYGEIAVNYSSTDPAVFIKDSNDNIIRIAGAGNIGAGDNPSGPNLPSTGNEVGDLFFDTGTNTLNYWNGTQWISLEAKTNDFSFVGTEAEVNAAFPPGSRQEGFLWWNEDNETLYVWYDNNGSLEWKPTTPVDPNPVANVTISNTPPATVDTEPGDLWWDSSDGRLYVYYEDADSAQWVDASPKDESLEDAPADGAQYARQDNNWTAVSAPPVTRLVAGTNITIDPFDGLGTVTINSNSGAGFVSGAPAMLSNPVDTSWAPKLGIDPSYIWWNPATNPPVYGGFASGYKDCTFGQAITNYGTNIPTGNAIQSKYDFYDFYTFTNLALMPRTNADYTEITFHGTNWTAINGFFLQSSTMGYSLAVTCKDKPNLTTLSGWNFAWNANSDVDNLLYGVQLDFSGNALNQTSVDNLLVSHLSSLQTSGFTFGGSTGYNWIKIDGGTNAAPSAAATAAINTLTSNTYKYTIDTN